MSDEHTTKTGFFRPLQIMTEVAAVPPLFARMQKLCTIE